MLLVNPNQSANRDIPSVTLGYLSAFWEAPVLDLNTCPEDVAKLYLCPAGTDVRAWVQSRSAGEYARLRSEHDGLRWSTVEVDQIRGQCCSPAVTLGEYCFVSPLPPVPRYDLFSSYETFRRQWSLGAWPYALYTSCGCVYGCSFCAERRGTWTPRPMTDLDAEVKQAVGYGVQLLTPIDPLLNPPHNAHHVIAVSEVFGRYNVQWMASNGLRADTLNDLQAAAMHKSGCVGVGFGIETSDDGLLRHVKKGETWADIRRGIEIAKAHFPSISGFLILGLPGSSYDVDRKTLDDCLDLGIYLHVSTYVPGADEGGLVSDLTFYGEGRGYSPVYSAEDQERLRQEYAGLAWGNARDWRANARGRLRLLRRGKVKAFGSLLRMDAQKLWRRVNRP